MMKRGPKIALGVFIAILVIAAAAGIGGSVYLFSTQQSMKADKFKAEADLRKIQSDKEMLKIELDDAREKLKNQPAGTSGQVTKHPLTGLTPVDIVKLALTLKGEDLTKLTVQQKTNDGAKAEVWVGPLDSEANSAYDFANQDTEWILIDVRKIGS